MFRNYIKIAFRSLTRNKAFSFVNIFGLAIGLTTCMLIMLYIFSQLGYDRQNKDADRIYRITHTASLKGETGDKAWAATSGPMAWGLKTDLPEVEQTTRLVKFPTFDKMLLKYEHGGTSKQFYEPNGYYVDSTFFDIFTYAFTYGDPRTALAQPNTVVLSEEVAAKLFGNENPVGRPITIGIPYGESRYIVKGVFRDKGIKSHIPAHLFLSMRNGDVGFWLESQTNWASNNLFHTYIKLRAGTDLASFDKKLQAFVVRRAGADLKAMGVVRKTSLQALPDIYLHSDMDGEIAPTGNSTYLFILSSIAAFVLLIACINFMNLATARSGKRAKEVGVRKVMGAEKRSLIFQFMGESVMMSCLSLFLALFLTRALIQPFNELTQSNLQFIDHPSVALWIAALAVCTGLLSGIYPAFYLSSFKPVVVLKGKLANSFSATAIRKGLVVFQFTISICLVLISIVIARQLHFMDNQDLGFKKDQQIVLPMQSQSEIKNYTALRDELVKTPGIKSVTGGSTYPGIDNIEDMPNYAEGKTVNDVVDVHLGYVEDNYFQTLGLTLLAGRTFSKNPNADSNSIIVNEATLRQFGYDLRTAIGRKAYFDFHGVHNTSQIIGVVKDFNFESLYNTIKPFAFNPLQGRALNYLIASLSTKDYPSVLKDIERVWNRSNPGMPFEYSFIDKDFQKNYQKDQRASGIVTYFTCIAIFIACLGLFGLSAFSAEQRIKEIGIRKVLGASITNITALLSRDFIRLVVIAILIASPLAWFGMHKWLQNFAYKTPVTWWMFALAGVLALLIAFLTVSFQAIRAGTANPVKNLRSE